MLDNSCSHRLLGKFFTDSTPPSSEETEQSLRKQWNISGNMTVQKLDDGSDTFLFEFSQEKDKNKVLDGVPYNVNGVILVIKDPNSSDKIDFTVVSFTVVVVGFPSYLYTKEYLPTLRSQVGDNNPVYTGKPFKSNTIICFQVEVDLKMPLRPGYYIAENEFVQFKYLKLGDFCYDCGMIGHVKENCYQVIFPKERALNATSITHVYGPWLRFEPWETCYQKVLMRSQNGVRGCDKTLSYAQFFIEIEFKNVCVCNPNPVRVTESTHKFRFPCSYLDTTDSTNITSKTHEVIRREIHENTPFSLGEFEDTPDVIASLVEELKVIKKNEFCCDDKWLTLKLQINKIHKLTPVDYETLLAGSLYMKTQRLIKGKISDLIKKRVEENKNLLCLSSWEYRIREVLTEVGYNRYMHLLDLSRIAYQAMLEAVRMEISSRSCTIPADRSTVLGLDRFKVLGSDMDRFDPCMICVGEMFLGEEATSLPCSHVFHSSCIEKWLQVGHKCPLCGFKLPSQK